MTSNAVERISGGNIRHLQTLDAVAEKYTKLVDVRDGLAANFNGALQAADELWSAEDPTETLFDPITDELHKLGWIVADSPATTLGMVKKKAEILADLIEDDESDLVSCLTKSLIDDIRRNS